MQARRLPRNADDIQVTLSADAHKSAMGWDQPAALAINLRAYNTRFFGAHAKRGKIGDYSALVVDHKYGSGKSLGKVGSCTPSQDGAYVSADGGATYTDLQCDSVQRPLVAKFAPDKSQALIATLDRIKSGAPHAYTWQVNLGNERGEDGVKATGGTEGNPMFLLKGRAGWVKSWVVHPGNAELKATGDPLPINGKGGDADIWVVLFVGQGAPPMATGTGTGMDSELTGAGGKVRFDAKANRMIAE